ncbi:RDD family protein [Microbacterium sp. SYP-A9085]|uniref:RDD family protein n=1 Tax=Microbacterium sp. SYP-A9085 TaxID=2664454 RepID=UPI00129BA785|nr:RDD family protein [Microbacterium sp. SYP-A9085]MRH28896.1 RDD family protein [Microbacterium sp. SYP-A9085]
MAVEPIAIVPDEVLTGEAVALDVQPLGFFLRALGTLIDVLVAVAGMLLLAWVSGWMLGEDIIGTDVSSILSILMIVLVTVVLPTAVETLSRGRSIGRLAVGGRIVRADGGAAGFRQALIRALVGVLEIWMTLGGLAALVGAFTPRSQRLGDLLAGTYCQRTRTPALPASAPGLPAALGEWAQVADVTRLPDPLARRCAQFVRQAERMQPSARARLAASLADEVAAFVSPLPATDAETLVRAVVAVRREREYAALRLEDDRVAGLVARTPAGPRGFPQR